MAEECTDIVAKESVAPVLAWARRTNSSIFEVRALRKSLHERREIQERRTEETYTEATPAATIHDLEKLRRAQDRLKRRVVKEQGLSSALQVAMNHAQLDIFDVGETVKSLSGEAFTVASAMSVVEKRLELRAKRPTPEIIRDDLQDALEQERQALNEAQELLDGHIASGKTAMKELNNTKVEMTEKKLTFAWDKDSTARSFLEKAQILELECAKFCKSANRAIHSTRIKIAAAAATTAACMKQRTAEELSLKRALEEEIGLAETGIIESQRVLHRMERNLKVCQEAPENDIIDPDADQAEKERLAASFPDSPTLNRVRARMLSAAYTGSSGRNLTVVFARFDTDHSGELDELEVRMAIRRTLRIPPSFITDAEIHLFFTLLDADRSGSINIHELIVFLQAGIDLVALEQQFVDMKANIEKLKVALESMVEDHTCKTGAWRIDESLKNVTPIKGFGFHDTRMAASSGASTAAADVIRLRRPPVGSKELEVIRNKMKAAAYAVHAGRELDTLFGRYDRERTGFLEDAEVRKAFRGALRVANSVISDSDISSLCCILDADLQGKVRISELVTFVGSDHMRLKLPVKPSIEKVAQQTPRRIPKVVENLNTWQDIGSNSPKALSEGASPRSPPEKLPRGYPLKEGRSHVVRSIVLAAASAYTFSLTQHADGRQLEVVFARFDKDRSGQLADDVVRKAMRRILRIPASVLSDSEISSLCATLDLDSLGTVPVKELLTFLGRETWRGELPMQNPGPEQKLKLAGFETGTGKSRSHDLPSAR